MFVHFQAYHNCYPENSSQRCLITVCSGDYNTIISVRSFHPFLLLSLLLFSSTEEHTYYIYLIAVSFSPELINYDTLLQIKLPNTT